MFIESCSSAHSERYKIEIDKYVLASMINDKEIPKTHLSNFLGFLNKDQRLATKVKIEPRAISKKPVGIRAKGSIRVPSGAIFDPIMANKMKHRIPKTSGANEK